MKIKINDVNLFFDIEGIGFSAHENNLVERPNLILLHGGPGNDHSSFRPSMSVLADIAHVIYIDQRGHGRSDRSTSSKWNLGQWTDDIAEFIDTLNLNKPIILGNSFGGFVAQSVALKYPEKISKLILSSTMATCRFDRIIDAFSRHGEELITNAAKSFWNNPTDEKARKDYRQICGPLYNTSAGGRQYSVSSIRNEDILLHFYGPSGEGRCFNFLSELKNITVPTLVLSGAKDHIATPDDTTDLIEALPKNLTKSFIFKNSGHGVYRDEPETAFPIIKDFILGRL